MGERGKRSSRLVAALAIASAWATTASSAPAPSGSPIAVASGAGSSAAAGSTSATSPHAPGPLPPGAADAPLPMGHPHVEPQGEDGEPGDGTAQAPGFRVPQDLSSEDPRLPAGVIVGRILDANEAPVAGESVTLGVLRNSVSQGEARSRSTTTTDAQGNFRFFGLQTGTGWAYRVSIAGVSADAKLSATYGVPPFNLTLDHGHSVVVHKFPITGSLDGLMAAVEGVDTAIEIRDDIVEVSQMYEIINASTTTWALGDGLTLKLPNGFKAVREADSMDDHHAAAIEGVGVKWTGSFAPGQWRIAYDFKLPYEGESAIDLDLELPPRVMAARVRCSARKGMSLEVDGFPAAKSEVSEVGSKMLSTLKRGSPQDEIRSLRVHVKGMPTQGYDRWIAMAVALVAVAIGVYLASQKRLPLSARDATAIRKAHARTSAALLEELAVLERARDAGDVGPQGFAKERERIVDALGAVLEQTSA